MTGTVRKAALNEVPVNNDRLENDPRFLQRIEQARNNLQAGRGVRLEDIEPE